jgi:hypothetical protein
MLGEGGSCDVSANEYVQQYTGAQMNFVDIIPYLTYVNDEESC